MSMMSEIELAERWGMSAKTLQRWRTDKRGPPYIKLGKNVRYRQEDVHAYEISQRKMPSINSSVSPDLVSPLELTPPAPQPDVPKMKLHEALRRLNDGTLPRR